MTTIPRRAGSSDATAVTFASCAAFDTIDERTLGVAEDERNLLGGQRRIDRHRGGAGRQDGEIGEQPLRTALGQDRDSVAARHSDRRQSQTEIADALDQVTTRDRVDAALTATAEEIRLRVAPAREEREHRDRFGDFGDRLGHASRGQYPALLSTTFISASPFLYRRMFSRN